MSIISQHLHNHNLKVMVIQVVNWSFIAVETQMLMPIQMPIYLHQCNSMVHNLCVVNLSIANDTYCVISIQTTVSLSFIITFYNNSHLHQGQSDAKSQNTKVWSKTLPFKRKIYCATLVRLSDSVPQGKKVRGSRFSQEADSCFCDGRPPGVVRKWERLQLSTASSAQTSENTNTLSFLCQ